MQTPQGLIAGLGDPMGLLGGGLFGGDSPNTLLVGSQTQLLLLCRETWKGGRHSRSCCYFMRDP